MYILDTLMISEPIEALSPARSGLQEQDPKCLKLWLWPFSAGCKACVIYHVLNIDMLLCYNCSYAVHPNSSSRLPLAPQLRRGWCVGLRAPTLFDPLATSVDLRRMAPFHADQCFMFV